MKNLVYLTTLVLGFIVFSSFTNRYHIEESVFNRGHSSDLVADSLNDHLTFKGVAIDGTLVAFVDEMQEQGFELVATQSDLAILQGDFAGYKDCMVGVLTLKQKDLVSKVTVMFPEYDNWPGLESNYNALQELLTMKYGSPDEISTEFVSLNYPSTPSLKMFAVTDNECNYFTTYELENGTIQLSISSNGYLSGFVMLSYFDKTNSQIIMKNVMEDL